MNGVQQEELGRQLIDAVEQGNVAQARELIEAGADVDQSDPDGDTSLHKAAKSGNIEMVRLLLRKKAIVDLEDGLGGWTPLYVAVENERIEVVRLLLGAGADVNAVDDEGWTPLHEAAESDDVRLLLSKEARMNAPSRNLNSSNAEQLQVGLARPPI